MPNPNLTETWQNRAKRIMRDREQITDIIGETDLTQSEESYFDVLEVQPDRSNDSETYLLTGNDESLATQTSLLLALKKMMGASGSSIDFDRWANNFEDGFPNWQNKSSRLSNITKPWAKNKEARPRIVKLKATTNVDYLLVEFFPDRNNLTESYLISGTQAQIVQEINLLWATINYLRFYDFGAILGYPIAEYLRQKPTSGIKLNICLAAFKEPPFTRVQFGAGGFEYSIQPRQVSIVMPRRDMLNYAAIRSACGGAGGLSWGNWSARAYIAAKPGTDNSRGLSQMVVGGATQEIANRNLDRFLALSEGFAVGRTCTEVNLQMGSRGSDPRSPYLKKYDVFPGWCFIENSELVAADDRRHKGRPTLSGKMVTKENKLFIWEEEEPTGWAATLQDLLKSPLT